MTQGISDLMKSERGVFAVLFLVASTVLVLVGRMNVDDWISLNKWIGVALIASKTLTTAVQIHSDGKVGEKIAPAVATKVVKEETEQTTPAA